MSDSPVYPYGDNLYLNLTSLCPTDCVFCLKHAGRTFRGRDLTLAREPTVDDAWSGVLDAAARRPFSEFVFCGYGESTYRLDAVRDLCARLKRCYPRTPRRLNTVGLGSAVWDRDIVPELAASLHRVRVSLNTADPDQWAALHRPRVEMRATGFDSVLGFVRSCVEAGLDTTVTAVELPGVDLAAVRRLAGALGASFLARPRLDARQARGE